jgi:hypothetical protein
LEHQRTLLVGEVWVWYRHRAIIKIVQI